MCRAGRDLIGVQNLMKKHQALQAELTGHEARITAVCEQGGEMVTEGHFAADDIQQKIKALQDRWNQLRVGLVAWGVYHTDGGVVTVWHLF